MERLSAQLDRLLAAVASGDPAAIYGNWLVIFIVCAVIVLWAFIAAIRLRLGVRRFVAEFNEARRQLDGTPADSTQFAGAYEATSAAFRTARILGPVWRDWDPTLITPVEAGRPVRATIRPGSYFTLDLLRECGINPRIHAAMPNLLVGVGLLLTFLGLMLALASAGGIADPNASSAGRQVGLKGLLDAASAKFATSLVGLLCSLLYTWWRAGMLRQGEIALNGFLTALEERVPLATAATLQAEANDILRESHAQLEVFNNNLAVNIGKAVDSTFNERLGEHIGPLREAIENLSGNLGTQNKDAIADMVRQFQEGLQGGATDQMNKLADVMQGMQTAMETVQTGLAASAQRMSDAADQMAAQMGRNAEEAMARISAQMEGLVRQLRELSDRSREEGSQALGAAAQRIAEAGEGFRAATDRMTTQIQTAMTEMTGRMGEDARTASRQLAAQLEEAVAALRALSNQSRQVGDDAARVLADRIAAAATAFETSAERIAEVMAGGAGEASQRLVTAVDELRSAFAAISSKAGREIADSAETAAARQRDGAEALSAAAEQAAQLIRAGGQDAAESLRQGGGEASTGLRGAAAELGAPARELAGRLVALQDGATGLAAATEQLRRDAATAGQPLVQAAERWGAIGASAMSTAEALNEAARRLAPLNDGLVGVAGRLEDAARQAAALASQLDAAVAGFKGVDDSLARTLNALQAALRSFASEIQDYALKTSNEMSQGVTALAGAIEELKDALPEPPAAPRDGRR